jgi:hypothetical protein
MAKLYATKKEKNNTTNEMKPKKETVSFLLNYSKALSYINVGKMKIENIAN